MFINILMSYLPRVLLAVSCSKGFSASFIRWITGRLRWEGTSGDCLVRSRCLQQGHLQQVLRAVSGWVLTVSKDGDSTASLGNLFYCLKTL